LAVRRIAQDPLAARTHELTRAAPAEIAVARIDPLAAISFQDEEPFALQRE
jgi:hypothetical protein